MSSVMDKVHFRPASDFKAVALRLFDRQKARVETLIPTADVQHIGSRAVDGSLTKGDLDINVRVAAQDFASAISLLRDPYDVNQPQNWTAGFASFKDDHSFELPLGIQLTVIDSADDDFTLLRDLLNHDPVLVEHVNAMKMRHEGGDVAAYRTEKAALYEEIKRRNANVGAPFIAPASAPGPPQLLDSPPTGAS